MHPQSARALDAGQTAEFEAALALHRHWLHRWHRARLCGQAPADDTTAPDAAHRCALGAWLQTQAERNARFPWPLAALERAHQALHEEARRLAGQAPGPLEAADYALLEIAADGFEQLVRPIELAFERALSDLDPLTGLLNRRAMRVALERERARCRRGGAAASIAIGDIDHFKAINDACGHGAGDRVLQAVAEVFLNGIRPYDSVYRYGGEEFLFCLPATDNATAQSVLDRLRAGLEDVRAPGLAKGGVSASFGVAPIDADASVDEAIERADRALYAAKRAGRNRVVNWHGPVPVAMGAVA